MDEKSKKVLNALQAQCAKREYCVYDIRRKALDRLEGDTAAADEVVQSLVNDSFVDDGRYACAFAREKAALNGWGPAKIRFALRSKGISGDNVATALGEIDSEKAVAKLQKLLETKWKSLCDDPQGKFKLIKFALSRGYEYDAVSSLVNKITSA